MNVSFSPFSGQLFVSTLPVQVLPFGTTLVLVHFLRLLLSFSLHPPILPYTSSIVTTSTVYSIIFSQFLLIHGLFVSSGRVRLSVVETLDVFNFFVPFYPTVVPLKTSKMGSFIDVLES